MSVIIRFILLFLQLTFISATFEIPFRCFIWDSGCLKTLAQIAIPAFASGFPDIGTKPLDPMYIPSLKVDESEFKGDITNLTMTGYKNSIVKNMFLDVAKSLLTIELQTDLTLNGRYKSNSEVEEVDLYMFIENIDMNVIVPFVIGQNIENNDIMQLKSYSYTYEIKESQSYIRDLFYKAKNNGIFFDSIQSWKLISIPFGRNFMDKYVDNLYVSLKTYLLSEPLRNLLEY